MLAAGTTAGSPRRFATSAKGDPLALRFLPSAATPVERQKSLQVLTQAIPTPLGRGLPVSPVAPVPPGSTKGMNGDGTMLFACTVITVTCGFGGGFPAFVWTEFPAVGPG